MAAKFANVAAVPLALQPFLASDNYDHNDDPFTISATTLLKPLRQIILASRVPAGEAMPNLMDLLKSRMGSAIHDAIERSWKNQNLKETLETLGYPKYVSQNLSVNPDRGLIAEGLNVFLEQRLKKQLGKWTITGKFDFISNGRVQDFKTTSTLTYMKQNMADKYVLQGSIYRWLDPQLITDDVMEIHYIFTNWMAGQVKTDPKYPTTPILTQRFELLGSAYIHQFIKNKLDALEKYWDADEQDIPDCSDEDLWRSEPVFKYYKNPSKTSRSTKNFETRDGAVARFIEDGSVGLIKEVPGEATACKYCPAFAACTQKDRLIASGDLIMT